MDLDGIAARGTKQLLQRLPKDVCRSTATRRGLVKRDVRLVAFYLSAARPDFGRVVLHSNTSHGIQEGLLCPLCSELFHELDDVTDSIAPIYSIHCRLSSGLPRHYVSCDVIWISFVGVLAAAELLYLRLILTVCLF